MKLINVENKRRNYHVNMNIMNGETKWQQKLN
jgi:hypothetical protein